jgi:hypothetical protein
MYWFRICASGTPRHRTEPSSRYDRKIGSSGFRHRAAPMVVASSPVLVM